MLRSISVRKRLNRERRKRRGYETRRSEPELRWDCHEIPFL
jgi:hypothetical protein